MIFGEKNHIPKFMTKLKNYPFRPLKGKKISFGLIIILNLISLTAIQTALAASIRLTWSKNTEPDIAGYKIFWGTCSGKYTNSSTIGNDFDDDVFYEIKQLKTGRTYYIALKAYDESGQESSFSKELTVYIPAPTTLSKMSSSSTMPGAMDTMDSEHTTQTDTKTVTQDSNIQQTDASDADNISNSLPLIVAGEVEVDNNWKTVQFDDKNEFKNPVIIVGPPSYNEADPCVVSIRKVTSTSFEIKINEWNYLSGRHAPENVSWMAIEAGNYKMPDGSTIEANSFDLDGTLLWRKVNFIKKFADTPIVFVNAESTNGYDTFTIRLTKVSTDSFWAAIEEEESKNDGHITERVGYLAISKNSMLNKFTIPLYNRFKYISNDSDIQMLIQEEMSRDIETFHFLETVGVLLFDNHIFGTIQTFNGADPVALRWRHN